MLMGLFIKSVQMIIITDLITSSSSMINSAMSCEILEGLGVVELCVATGIIIVLIDISRYGLGVYRIKS